MGAGTIRQVGQQIQQWALQNPGEVSQIQAEALAQQEAAATGASSASSFQPADVDPKVADALKAMDDLQKLFDSGGMAGVMVTDRETGEKRPFNQSDIDFIKRCMSSDPEKKDMAQLTQLYGELEDSGKLPEELRAALFGGVCHLTIFKGLLNDFITWCQEAGDKIQQAMMSTG